jgi:hypothetical protein
MLRIPHRPDNRLTDGGEVVTFYVSTAMTMKNAVFLDVIPRGSCENRRFGRTYRFYHQGDRVTSVQLESSAVCSKYPQSVLRSEVFTAVTMKNAVFWNIRTQFVLHRRRITSPL